MWEQRHEPRQFHCSEGSDLTSQLILCILTESGQDHQGKKRNGNFQAIFLCHDIQIPTTCAILCTYLVIQYYTITSWRYDARKYIQQFTDAYIPSHL